MLTQSTVAAAVGREALGLVDILVDVEIAGVVVAVVHKLVASVPDALDFPAALVVPAALVFPAASVFPVASVLAVLEVLVVLALLAVLVALAGLVEMKEGQLAAPCLIVVAQGQRKTPEGAPERRPLEEKH